MTAISNSRRCTLMNAPDCHRPGNSEHLRFPPPCCIVLSNAEGGPPFIQLDEKVDGRYGAHNDPATAAGVKSVGVRNSPGGSFLSDSLSKEG